MWTILDTCLAGPTCDDFLEAKGSFWKQAMQQMAFSGKGFPTKVRGSQGS